MTRHEARLLLLAVAGALFAAGLATSNRAMIAAGAALAVLWAVIDDHDRSRRR